MTNTAHYAQSESVEWYTPRRYVDAARRTMGRIDLDPASNDTAQQWIAAGTHYTAEDNGLALPWFGAVWLNPPYGREPHSHRPSQDVWTERLLAEYDAGNVHQAILLITNATDSARFNRLFNFPICFTSHRIGFVDAKGRTVRGNTKGSAFVYLPPKPTRDTPAGVRNQIPWIGHFVQNFAQFGNVVGRINAGARAIFEGVTP